jgi:hypothetical protein
MSNLPVDRDENYMKEMWGTTKLITDYDSSELLKKAEELEAKPTTFGGKDYSGHYTYGYGFFRGRSLDQQKNSVSEENTQFLQEITDYHQHHELKKQTDLHEKIRNDDDYDDWEYGTEPNYGKKW